MGLFGVSKKYSAFLRKSTSTEDVPVVVGGGPF